MTTSSSDMTASYEELSTLYEACLLDYRQVVDCEKSQENADFGRTLTARVALQSAVQCAAAAAATSRPHPAAAAQALWKRTTLDLDEDAASAEQVLALENLRKKESSAERLLSLPKVEVDVDAFFEVYPECGRLLCREESGSDSSEDEDEAYERHSHEKHRRRVEKGDSSKRVHVVGQNVVLASQEEPKQEAPRTTVNPYASRQVPRNVLLATNHVEVDLTKGTESVAKQSWYRQEQQQLINPPPATTYHAPAQNHHPNPRPPAATPQSWDDHARGQGNPFQTARECNLADNRTDETTQHRTPTSYNPYAQKQQQQQPTKNNNSNNSRPPQPLIRESLKRKFQPPNKRVTTNRVGGEVSFLGEEKKKNQMVFIYTHVLPVPPLACLIAP